jgi:nifR3 family TIM-barrel protein
MHENFYKNLKRPVMTLAPMSGVTDEAFRQMLLKCGRPDVFWTEFVSTDGLFSPGKEKLLECLKFAKAEHPIVAQVFGDKPELFERTAILVRRLGFDGLDINMGCPNKDIEKQGAGAVLIKNPDLARRIIRAAKKGAGKMPVSVKTRIGYKKEQIDRWVRILLEEKPAALTVHFRVRDEMFKGLAHWEFAQKIVKLKDSLSPETLIFGNGDVKSLDQARRLSKETGLDGIMIGRGVLANPWFFSKKSPSPAERIDAIIEHAKIFEKLNHVYRQAGKNNIDKKARIKNFDSVKKFFKSYASGFDGAKELREKLFQCKNSKEVEKVVKNFRKDNSID